MLRYANGTLNRGMFKMMKEFQLKKNILGLLLTVCGAYTLIIANVLNFYAPALVVILALGLGIIMMIAGLFFIETFIKGSALVFSGIQLILFEVIIQLLGESSTPRLLLWIGVPALVIGIILVMVGFHE